MKETRRGVTTVEFMFFFPCRTRFLHLRGHPCECVYSSPFRLSFRLSPHLSLSSPAPASSPYPGGFVGEWGYLFDFRECAAFDAAAAAAAAGRPELVLCASDAAANTLGAFSPGGHNFRDGANGLEGRRRRREWSRQLTLCLLTQAGVRTSVPKAYPHFLTSRELKCPTCFDEINHIEF